MQWKLVSWDKYIFGFKSTIQFKRFIYFLIFQIGFKSSLLVDTYIDSIYLKYPLNSSWIFNPLTSSFLLIIKFQKKKKMILHGNKSKTKNESNYKKNKKKHEKRLNT